MNDKKIAVFFDCENISSKYVNEIFNELAKIGEVTIKKAYHNWRNSQSSNWIDKVQEFAIEPIQVFPNIVGKNAVDSKLIIDVVNTTHQSDIDVIVLVSSDSDFTTLAIDVKSKGIESIGFGEKKTPISLRKSFSKFYELPRKNKKTKAILLLKEAIKNTKNEDDYANLSLISKYLINKDSSLNAQNYGYERWSDLLKEESQHFILEYKKNNSQLLVKIKS